MKNRSEQINELATALSKAQHEIVPPEKNRTVQVSTKTGGRYTFHYADLGAITEAVKLPLSQNGLSVTHMTEMDEQGFWLVTVLLHSSGQWLSSRYPLPRSTEAKEVGSAITYGKRYLMSALLNVSADDDNDAEPNLIAEVTSRNAQSSAPPSPGTQYANQAQRETRSNPKSNQAVAKTGGMAPIRSVTPVKRDEEAPHPALVGGGTNVR